MLDRDRWLVHLIVGALFVAGMAALVTATALVLGTTGHEWYAAWKLTLVEAMLAVGFDQYGTVEYRTAEGASVTVERYRLAYSMVEPWQGRNRILSLIADRGVLGAWTGLGVYVLWLGVRAVAFSRRFGSGRDTVVEPAPRVRPGFAGRMRNPESWSDSELIGALVRRSGRLGVLLVPADEVERLASGHGQTIGAAAMPLESLPPSPTAALPPSDGAEQTRVKAGRSAKSVAAGTVKLQGKVKEDNRGKSKAGRRKRGRKKVLY